MEDLKSKNVLIVGAGVAGLSTSLHLARAGVPVTVLDYQPYNVNGYSPSKGCDAASADVNKIFRASYGKEVEYQKLAFEARDIWAQWNKDLASTPRENLPEALTPDMTIFHECGVVRIPHHPTAPVTEFEKEGMQTLSDEQRSKHYILSSEEDRKRANGAGLLDKLAVFKWEGDGVLDMTGGYTVADKACAYAQYLCTKAGVKFVFGEAGKAVNLVKEGGKVVGVKTIDGQVHSADLVILACGGWTPSLLPEVCDRLETTAGSVVQFQLPPKVRDCAMHDFEQPRRPGLTQEKRPDLWDKFSPERSVVWTKGFNNAKAAPRANIYGFPRTEDGIIKIGYRGIKFTNFVDHPLAPGLRISYPKTKYTPEKESRVPVISIEVVKDTIKEILPDLAEHGKIVDTRLCWYCDSLDNNFLVDYVPQYGDSLAVVSGGSGHMFKFLPVLGKHVLDVLTHKDTEYTQMWKWPMPEKETIPWVDKTNGLEQGELGAVVASVEREDTEKSKNGPIRVAAANKAQTHLATSSDDKRLRVWEVESLKLLSERELPKKATSVLFTQDGQTILVSDKFGDVFAYPLHPPVEEQKQEQEKKREKDGLASHENPSNGDLVLGHVSLLTACILTHDERYIITADRDEHIRVSWYPQAYEIESFCLGNEKFVSALHIPASVPDRLISGGGDPVLRVWDWMNGTIVREIPVLDVVEPTIKVKSLKRKWGDDGEGSAPRKKKRKGKGKGKDVADAAEDAAEGTPEQAAEASKAEEEGKTVLVVHKIETLRAGEGQPLHVVFSAVGSTALFACPFDEEASAGVQAFDFGVPVLDFATLPDDRILVSLDFQWGDEASRTGSSVKSLQLVDGKLTEVAEQSPLVTTLNTTCLKPATNDARDALDLYGALASMPKFNIPAQEDEGDATPVPDEPMTKRQMGRMKNKSAVLAKKAAASGGVAGGAETVGGAARTDEGVEGEEEERDSKRARSDEGEPAGESMET
ncbi:nucleotide-binding domain-containing protein [Schizophyllum commune H4-8]|nr:nucleotide-binding domain-containing protein [Schizophyllum commune H4-8]KAI5895290.1 nucleotide-binding domain-containing protein [Schizophyllum commune H4-8]